MNSLNRALLKKLSDDPVRFCNQIGFLSQYPADSVEYAGESFFFRGKSDYLWIFFAVREKKDLYKLKKKLTVKDRNFASVPVHFLNELELPGASSAFIAGQYFLPRDVNIYRKNDFADTLHVGDA